MMVVGADREIDLANKHITDSAGDAIGIPIAPE
jgi:hypothetical protein